MNIVLLTGRVMSPIIVDRTNTGPLSENPDDPGDPAGTPGSRVAVDDRRSEGCST
jgi:hypothetical protein